MMRARDSGRQLSPAIAGSVGKQTHDPGAGAPGFMLPSASRTRIVMVGITMRNHWQVVGESVRGAVHERNGLPNQDAIYWLPASGEDSSIVLAVADGHGSARYSRSHIGASLAVETSAQLVHEFINGQADNLSLLKDATEDWLPRALVRKWVEVVTNHCNADPLSNEESPIVAYGATLIVAAVSERFA